MIISFKEIFLKILIHFSALIMGVILILFVFSYYETNVIYTFPLLFIPFIFSFILTSKIKAKIKIAEFVAHDMDAMGYKILSEHNFKCSDYPFDIKINTRGTFNHIPLSRFDYFRKFYRIFMVKNEHNEQIEIKAEIINFWNGDNNINILNTKAI
jgi:hypothetical protein